MTQVTSKAISQHISYIHIESPNFQASTLFEEYHPRLKLKELQAYHKAIPAQMGRTADNLLAEYFFEGLVDVERQASKAR